VLGVDIGDSEDETFWTKFLRSLNKRGLGGVRLVTSDAHEGLKAAICKCFQGASWQRCRVHYARNLLTNGPSPAATSPKPPWRSSTNRATLTPSRPNSRPDHTEHHTRNPTTPRDSV